MEKNYFHNLYKNIKKYNFRLKNNYYIINKINSLIGGTLEDEKIEEVARALQEIDTDLTNYMQQSQQQNEQQNTEYNTFVSQVNSFLDVVKPYIDRQQTLGTHLTGIGLDDAKLQQLESIQTTFESIQEKVSQLI